MKIQELSNSEKVILVQELWGGVAADQKALEISQEQASELDRRLAQLELDGETGSSWLDVKKRVLKRECRLS